MSADAPAPARFDALRVAGFAAMVQVAQLVALRGDPTVRGPVIDGWTFHLDAARLATGAPSGSGLYWQSPWFVWLLSGLYRLVGADPARGLWLPAACAVLCAALVHALAARCGLTRREAVAAGVAASLYGPLLFFSSQLIAAPLDAAAALLALLAAMRAAPGDPLLRHGLAGLALGFAAAQRGTVWPFALYGLGALWGARASLGARAAGLRAAVSLAGAALAQLPVAVGNLRRAGSFTTLTTNAGVNLWIGNNPDLAHTTAVRPGCGWDWLTLTPIRHGVFSSVGRSRWFTLEALRWALEHPGAALLGTLKKLSDTLNGLEVARNLDPYGELARTPLNAALLGREGLRVPFGLVLPLAVLGAWTLAAQGDRRREGRALAAFAALGALGVALFLPAGRYRLALALALLPAAVRGATRLVAVARRAADAPPGVLLAALLAGLYANLAPRFTGPDLTRADDLLRAEALLNARVLPAARATLEASVARLPRDVDRWELLSRVCFASGDTACAEQAMQRAITLEPRCYDVAARLGGLRLARGDARGAIDAFERSIRVVPMQPSTWFGLAAARDLARDPAGAARARGVGERLRAAILRAP
ncbi:MAG: hypothetical protein U0325_34280 [Polyangiales bacterium]